MKSILKISLVLAIFLAIPAYGIDILHKGVKINGKRLAETKFLITRAELDSFNETKEKLKASDKIIKEKEIKISAYQEALMIMVKLLASVETTANKIKDKAIESTKDTKKVLKQNKRLRKQNNLWEDIGKAALIFGIARGVKLDFKF